MHGDRRPPARATSRPRRCGSRRRSPSRRSRCRWSPSRSRSGAPAPSTDVTRVRRRDRGRRRSADGAFARRLRPGVGRAARPERRLPRGDRPARDGRRSSTTRRARPRSITLHYLRPPAAGPLRIDVVVERTGRTLSTLSARLTQDDRLCVIAIGGVRGRLPGGRRRPVQRADAGRPAGGARSSVLPAHEAAPPIRHRFVHAPRGRRPSPSAARDEALTGGWISLHEPQPLDAATLAFYADAWLPPVVQPARRAARGADDRPHDPLPRPVARPRASPPTSRSSASSARDYAADGLAESDGELWSPDGVLLAHSRQLMLLLPWTPS